MVSDGGSIQNLNRNSNSYVVTVRYTWLLTLVSWIADNRAGISMLWLVFCHWFQNLKQVEEGWSTMPVLHPEQKNKCFPKVLLLCLLVIAGSYVINGCRGGKMPGTMTAILILVIWGFTLGHVGCPEQGGERTQDAGRAHDNICHGGAWIEHLYPRPKVWFA